MVVRCTGTFPSRALSKHNLSSPAHLHVYWITYTSADKIRVPNGFIWLDFFGPTYLEVEKFYVEDFILITKVIIDL